MRRVHICSAAVLLAVSAGAWAGVEPYPTAVQGEDVSTKTRSQVIGELHEAIRLGQMYDLPTTYAQKQMFDSTAAREVDSHAAGQARDGRLLEIVVWGDPRMLRAKLQAEAAEANRLGLLRFGEGDPPVATAAQEEQIAAAGRRAVEGLRLAGRLG